MRPEKPSQMDIWLARALLVAGLWFCGAALWHMIRYAPEISQILWELPGLFLGIFLLAWAWRMRAAIRWDPEDDD